jgi:glycosyltransferase involved in cell wall biosynthesis
MNILFCVSSLDGGGAERQLYYLSTELARNGNEVHVFYIWESNGLKKDWGLVNLHSCYVKSNYSLKIFFHLYKLCNKIDFDIVQTWVVQMDILLGILVRFFNFKWIIRESSSSKNYEARKSRNSLRIYLSKKASFIVANSLEGCVYWKSLNRNKNIKFISNGVPYDLIGRSIEVDNNHTLSIGDDYILYVGRLICSGSANKNIEKLILACDLVFENKNNLKLLIVGQGNDLENLKSLVKDRNLDSHIFFLGFIESELVYKLMSNASLFISLSGFEGMPNSVLEAMYCSKRILLSNINEHKALFKHPDADDFTDIDKVDVIAKRILEKLNSKSKIDYYKSNTIDFSMDRMVENYENLYLKVTQINL